MKKSILIILFALLTLAGYSQNWDNTGCTSINYAELTADTMLFFPVSGGSGVTVCLVNETLSDSIGYAWGWSATGYDYMEQVLPSGLTFPQYLNPADSVLVNGSKLSSRGIATAQYMTAKAQYLNTVLTPWLVLRVYYTAGITGYFKACIIIKQ